MPVEATQVFAVMFAGTDVAGVFREQEQEGVVPHHGAVPRIEDAGRDLDLVQGLEHGTQRLFVHCFAGAMMHALPRFCSTSAITSMGMVTLGRVQQTTGSPYELKPSPTPYAGGCFSRMDRFNPIEETP